MSLEDGTNESVERAFSGYVKACLQHAQKDYFEKLRRDSVYTIPLDAVTFEININFLVHPYDIPQPQHIPVFSQMLELLNLSSKEKKVLYHKYYEDKTDKEISLLLGISRQAVSKMKSNVLVKIKRIMEQ
ncbi:sigma factor-like helix-turn-helix DNA-binding protein [Paenibacillus humicus]|uniref:sigma factor-like helix-turn-helix DNA-binding protein n=1 Tax=Paenibacillus humicus TaxID=412861 RepID=UPI003F147B9E